MKRIFATLAFAVTLALSAALAQAQTVTWTKVVDQYNWFTVTGTQTYRMGSPAKGQFCPEFTVTNTTVLCQWNTVPGCPADPSPGYAKECDLKTVTGGLPPPPPQTVSVWGPNIGENTSMLVPADTSSIVMRFGAGSSWLTKTVTPGTYPCTTTYFGGDPAPGQGKTCALDLASVPSLPTNATAYNQTTGMPYIDTTHLITPAVGFSTNRMQSAAGYQAPTYNGVEGDFRDSCDASHMNFDDPIKYPGTQGASHLHVYFGNTSANYQTNANPGTTGYIKSTGNSTCAGGLLNRSAYWAPAIIDTRTGAPVKPSGSNFYYKTDGMNTPSLTVAMPAGLRMIAGDATTTTAGNASIIRYSCPSAPDSSWYPSMRNCPVGQDMMMSVSFPNCWDGVNLDSPDHKSHMSYPVGGVCPTGFPQQLPHVTHVLHYTVLRTDAPLRWRLASDNYDYSQPAGYSGHADWFGGWDTTTMSTFVTSCLKAAYDCHDFLLGNGQMLY